MLVDYDHVFAGHIRAEYHGNYPKGLLSSICKLIDVLAPIQRGCAAYENGKIAKMKWQSHTEKKNQNVLRYCAWFFSVAVHGAMIMLVMAVPKLAFRSVKMHSVNVAAVFKNSDAFSVSASDGIGSSNPIGPVVAPKSALPVKKAGKDRKDARANIVDASVGAMPTTAGGDGHAPERGESATVQFRANPMLLNSGDVKISYPEQARQLMIEGIVKMRLTVSESGRVIDAQILSGPYFGLRSAALVVARKLFFLPATDEQGRARTAKIDHEVVFRLNKRS